MFRLRCTTEYTTTVLLSLVACRQPFSLSHVCHWTSFMGSLFFILRSKLPNNGSCPMRNVRWSREVFAGHKHTIKLPHSSLDDTHYTALTIFSRPNAKQ
ncbi:hypothetical protein BDV38DRAFT_160675 [Aspergillus pseudotamarii]|uniref:Uncharacterized protein n=1 Tax=Aspergillus pseudotamarii TaxID=132259 RepID=A0A5N6SIJ8_ASPPS|nr:uncharacterized protein BDV38DRAFT_160675 [Aspergillus pseudotamarii]KAE8134512.1 hypothetical protein BDV38DRAFT_160675 [Aspergillus pseudotamarii]